MKVTVAKRLRDDAQCLLVIIGATPAGKKELVGLTDGVRESTRSWRELLLDLKRRGLSMGPELAVADGALGFWQALEEVWPRTRGQRCWVHKTANVLNKLPKSQQSKAKRALQEIWMAETKKDALLAFDAFIETWGVKYDRATEYLIKDRDALPLSDSLRRPGVDPPPKMTQGGNDPPNPPSSPSTASLSGVARCWHSNAYFSLFSSLFFFDPPNRFVHIPQDPEALPVP